MSAIKHVIWDWNGTLLDDVDCCVSTLNVLRAARGLPGIDRDQYRARFGFPVRAFYESIGFTFADDGEFAALSRAFIAEYQARGNEMRLQAEALAVLATLTGRGVSHVVISAMETTLLGQMLGDYGVRAHVSAFQGRDDLSAASKVELGVAAARRMGLRPHEVLLIGDTLHDHELAQAIGCRALMYAGGHQTAERLAAAGVPVVDTLSAVPETIASLTSASV